MSRIIFITDKHYFNSKMDRVRFHSVKAIFNHKNIEGTYTGPNWPNWNPSLPAQENLENILKGDWCDLVVCYKPSEIEDFPEIKYTKCIRYNETYDKESVKEEVSENKIDTIIFHHHNDYVEYKNILNNLNLFWIPHSAEKTIFKPNHNVDKVYDVALIGAVDATTMLGDHYPLRLRMSKLLKEMPSKYNCATIPSSDLNRENVNHDDAHTDKYAYDFADKINSSKIIITDSGVPKSRFVKYIEVPMCGTALAGDIYEDHPDDIKKLKTFLIEINMQMSDEEIINKLVFYLENEGARQELIKNGIEYAKDFTHERYAERFTKVLESSFIVARKGPPTNTTKEENQIKYSKYIKLQKEKTTDPQRRKKWLNEEWHLKINGFKKIFSKNEKYIGDKCFCIGARTGQEVQSLIDIGKEAIGIDLVPQEPLVLEGDFHNISFGDESFDFVFSNVFDHALYPEKFCSEAFRVLKTGGFALFHLQLNVPNDKYGVHSLNDINKDFVNHLPRCAEVISLNRIFYTEFATFNLEAVLKKTKSSIQLNLTVGLGNNLFQSVYAKLLSDATGQEVQVSPPPSGTSAVKSLLPFFGDFKISKNENDPSDAIYISTEEEASEALKSPKERSYLLDGYFEDYSLYEDIEKIKSWFSPIETTNTSDLVLHLRLGDRLFIDATYKEESFLTFEKYAEAIDLFDFDTLYIVSDLPEWKKVSPEDLDGPTQMGINLSNWSGYRKDEEIKKKAAAYVNDLIDKFSSNYKVCFQSSGETSEGLLKDFNFIRSFDKIIFGYSTFAWWAATTSKASQVAVFEPWRPFKTNNKNLGKTNYKGWFGWGNYH